MAAYLLCKDYRSDLIQAGTRPDYPFLILLDDYSSRPGKSYKTFLETVLLTCKPGSNTQVRALSRIAQEVNERNRALVFNILKDPKIDLGVRYHAMQILLAWAVEGPEVIEVYKTLLPQNAPIALALFAQINEIRINNYVRKNDPEGKQTNFKPAPFPPTVVAQLAFDYLLATETLTANEKVVPFKQSKTRFPDQPFVFSSDVVIQKTQIEAILDILLHSGDHGWHGVFAKQLETNNDTPSTTDLIERLNKMKDKVDIVAQNKIDKFVSSLTKALNKYKSSAKE